LAIHAGGMLYTRSCALFCPAPVDYYDPAEFLLLSAPVVGLFGHGAGAEGRCIIMRGRA